MTSRASLSVGPLPIIGEVQEVGESSFMGRKTIFAWNDDISQAIPVLTGLKNLIFRLFFLAIRLDVIVHGRAQRLFISRWEAYNFITAHSEDLSQVHSRKSIAQQCAYAIYRVSQDRQLASPVEGVRVSEESASDPFPIAGLCSEEADEWRATRWRVYRWDFALSDFAFSEQDIPYINMSLMRFGGGTVLHALTAAPRNYPEFDEKLAERFGWLATNGANPAVQDRNQGDTPLMLAVSNAENDIAITMLHIFKGGDYLNVQDGSHYNTALHLAVGKGYIDQDADGRKLNASNQQLVDALLAYAADPNRKNAQGNTPLHLACLRKDRRMVESLLRAGADPSIKNDICQVPADLLSTSVEEASQLLGQTVGRNCFNIKTLIFPDEETMQQLQRLFL